jgi:probable HAF family extracellular repeat protein
MARCTRLTGGGYEGQWDDVNNAGQGVGTLMNVPPWGEQHWFLWDGQMHDLGLNGQALGINDLGQVVGASTAASGEWHVFLWEDGTSYDLGTPGGGFGYAEDINNVGQIVVMGYDPSGDFRPFLWDDGVMYELPHPLGNSPCYAQTLNDAGQVVGWCGFYSAVLWRRLTPVEHLGSCAALVSELEAQDVLNKGQAHSFINKINLATAMLNDGKNTPAINVLEAFQNEASGYVNGGNVTPEQGAELISCVQVVIDDATRS